MKHFKFKKGILACLLSLALAFSCFSTVGIRAEEAAATATAPSEVSAEYKWAENIITSTTATAYVYVLKAEKGNTIKAGTAANGQMASGKISLADLKVTKINKDAYFYVCDKEFEAEGKSINANLVIKATSVKKAAGTIDYTQADDDDSLTVLSATATDTSGKKIADPKVYWSTEANGTYYAVGDDTTSTTRKYADEKTAAKNGFDGRTLKEMLESGGVVYIKIAGEDGGTGTAQFASKAIKVKVAKQAKAPKVKVDVKKDTFSIKNGMDFGLFTKTTNNGTDSYNLVNGWKTVLPQLKDAATKELAASIVDTRDYKPVDKKDDAAKKVADETTHKVSYTSLKIKNLGYETLVSSLSAEDTDTTEYYIGVRTSATSKKPASAVTYFKYAEKTEAPIVYTESCVSGQYLVASGTDFDKKGIILKDVANYNGTNGTSGYDDSFKVETTAGSGADTNTASYEFAVVNVADLGSIDWSTVGWKKLDVAKTKITSKLKTAYSTVSGTTVKKVKAQLSAVAKPAGFTGATIPTEVKSLLLVRRTGVKGKTADDSVVASDFIKLYVLKDGKNYEIYSETSVGEEAYKYTVEFYKWSVSGESTDYIWKKDDSLTVTGWGNDSTEMATIAAVTGADLFKIENDANTDLANEVTSLSGGKLVVEVDDENLTEKYAIREYANVKIVAEVSISGESTKKEETLVTIKNGKSSISGDNTVYYVGTEFTIPTASIPAVSSISGYETGSATSVSGGVTVDGNNFKATVNTAEETTVKVAYTRTAKTYAVTQTLNDATLGNITGIDNNQATYKTNVTFKVATTPDKKVVDKVTYKVGSANAVEITANASGVYTIPGDKILDALTITVTVKDAPSEG